MDSLIVSNFQIIMLDNRSDISLSTIVCQRSPACLTKVSRPPLRPLFGKSDRYVNGKLGRQSEDP